MIFQALPELRLRICEKPPNHISADCKQQSAECIYSGDKAVHCRGCLSIIAQTRQEFICSYFNFGRSQSGSVYNKMSFLVLNKSGYPRNFSANGFDAAHLPFFMLQLMLSYIVTQPVQLSDSLLFSSVTVTVTGSGALIIITFFQTFSTFTFSRFRRILPLPSFGWADIAENVFCHGCCSNQKPAKIQKTSIQPKTGNSTWCYFCLMKLIFWIFAEG